MSLKSVLLNLNTYFFSFISIYIFISSGSIISLLIISAMLKTVFSEFNSKEFKRRSITSSSLESHAICLHRFNNVDDSHMRA